MACIAMINGGIVTVDERFSAATGGDRTAATGRDAAILAHAGVRLARVPVTQRGGSQDLRLWAAGPRRDMPEICHG